MTSLSVCMMVQNSEKTLAIALESLNYVYDELIIVDGGSTDATCDIALSYGAKIIHSPWTGNHSQQRNVYLSHLKTDWFFTIDADEFIDIKTLEFLNFLKLNSDWPTTDNYMILRKWISPFSNKFYIISEPYRNEWQSRLIRYNPNFQYNGLIHEGLEGLQYEPQTISEISLYHLDLFINSEEERRKKICRYVKKYFELGSYPPFLFHANYLYLPSSFDLQFAVLNDEEMLPSVRKMLEELQPATAEYFDYLDIPNELDIHLIKLSAFIQNFVIVGNSNNRKIITLFIDLIKQHNHSIVYADELEELQQGEILDLVVLNSEKEIDFDRGTNFKLVFIDKIHDNPSLYMRFLISDEYRLLCHQTYGLEQWALFENENLSDFSQQIIRENINIKPVDFNLKELNYIVFPDWLQPEESIRLELQEVIKTLATHPDSEKITLLIYAGNVDTEEAEMLISAIAMNLLMEDNLHISQDLQISLIGELFHREWESLLPFITERIVLSGEDEEMLKKLVIRDLNLAN